jgi:hypothetical protein
MATPFDIHGLGAILTVYRPPAADSETESNTDVRVMSVVWGSPQNKTSSFAVVLDPEGEVIAHLKLNFIAIRPTSERDKRASQDLERLKQVTSLINL